MHCKKNKININVENVSNFECLVFIQSVCLMSIFVEFSSANYEKICFKKENTKKLVDVSRKCSFINFEMLAMDFK